MREACWLAANDMVSEAFKASGLPELLHDHKNDSGLWTQAHIVCCPALEQAPGALMLHNVSCTLQRPSVFAATCSQPW